MSLAATRNIAEGFDDITAGAAVMPDPTTLVQPSGPVIDPLGAFSQNLGQQPDPHASKTHDPARTAELSQKLDAILNAPPGPVWKPANIINANSPINGAQNYKRIEGDAKQAAATTMEQQIQTQLAETLKQMEGAGGPPAGNAGRSAEKAGTPTGSSVTGSIVGDTAMGIALAPFGLPAAIAATVVMAAKAGLEGQGTLVTFNKPGEWTAASSRSNRRNGKNVSSFGYGSAEQPAATQSAPVSTDFQKKLNQGPGFGRYDVLAQSTLTGETLNGVTRIKIPEDSPAGRLVEGMKINAGNVLHVMNKQRTEGIDATLDNLLKADNFGMEDQIKQTTGLKIPTFVM